MTILSVFAILDSKRRMKIPANTTNKDEIHKLNQTTVMRIVQVLLWSQCKEKEKSGQIRIKR